MIGVIWGLSPNASLFKLIIVLKKLETLLNFCINVSWKLLEIDTLDKRRSGKLTRHKSTHICHILQPMWPMI